MRVHFHKDMLNVMMEFGYIQKVVIIEGVFPNQKLLGGASIIMRIRRLGIQAIGLMISLKVTE
jgi:hypothetical protein